MFKKQAAKASGCVEYIGSLSPMIDYLTVTAFVRCLGLSGSSPLSTAM